MSESHDVIISNLVGMRAVEGRPVVSMYVGNEQIGLAPNSCIYSSVGSLETHESWGASDTVHSSLELHRFLYCKKGTEIEKFTDFGFTVSFSFGFATQIKMFVLYVIFCHLRNNC